MILVTVGMHTQGFDRLIKKMDEIAVSSDEEIVMQIGHSQYTPKNTEFFRFKSVEEIGCFFRRARLVVCHDGAGSILSALQNSKPTIVVPRMKKYGEVAYDSQAELAKELENRGIIKVVYDIEELDALLRNSDISLNAMKSTKALLINSLKCYINGLDTSARASSRMNVTA